MEIRLPVENDTHNSYPSGDMTVIVSAGVRTDRVTFQYSDENREVSVSLVELQAAITALRVADARLSMD